MSTIENNKLIAEFMGYNVEGDYLTLPDMLESLDLEEEVHFHSSWEWLMPVVRKLNEVVDIKKGEEGIVNGLIMGDIEYTYSHLVDCIKWYNENK